MYFYGQSTILSLLLWCLCRNAPPSGARGYLQVCYWRRKVSWNHSEVIRSAKCHGNNFIRLFTAQWTFPAILRTMSRPYARWKREGRELLQTRLALAHFKTRCLTAQVTRRSHLTGGSRSELKDGGGDLFYLFSVSIHSFLYPVTSSLMAVGPWWQAWWPLMALDGKPCHPATFFHTNPLNISEVWTATTFYTWMLETSNVSVLLIFSCSLYFWCSQSARY